MADIMRPVQARDSIASLLEECRHMRLNTPGGQVETVTPIDDKKLAVTFTGGTRVFLHVAVYRAQDSSDG